MGVSQYRTILADPPWPYRQRLQGSRVRGGVKYPTMAVEEIAVLPIRELVAPECQCWLWATNTHLHDAFHVLEAWGFQYVTTVTWAKTQFGLGYWLRGQTEHLLLGVKGKPRKAMTGPHGASGGNWSTLVTAARGIHSEKPQVFYDMVEALGEPPRLELFARRQRLGWDVAGDEVGVIINSELFLTNGRLLE